MATKRILKAVSNKIVIGEIAMEMPDFQVGGGDQCGQGRRQTLELENGDPCFRTSM